MEPRTNAKLPYNSDAMRSQTPASRPWPAVLAVASIAVLIDQEAVEPWLSSMGTGVVIAVWFAVLGSVWGSFFNVVAYRMPRGMSIIHPGSHCPACRHPIRLHDNIPVLSWFLLRGRCRDCQARISPRYPVIETVSALLFAVLAYVEVSTGGINLPRPDLSAMTAPPLAFWTDLQLLGVCVFHLPLVSGLLCAALIEIDGHAVPRRLAALVLAVGLVVPLIWPFLHPVAALGTVRSGLDPWSFGGGAIDGLAGLSIGAVLALVARLGSRADDKFDPRNGLFFGFMAVGVFLGWQAAVFVAATAAVLILAIRVYRSGDARRRQATAWTPWLAVGAMAWIVFWNPSWRMVSAVSWLTPSVMLTIAVAMVAAASLLARIVSNRTGRGEL